MRIGSTISSRCCRVGELKQRGSSASQTTFVCESMLATPRFVIGVLQLPCSVAYVLLDHCPYTIETRRRGAVESFRSRPRP